MHHRNYLAAWTLSSSKDMDMQRGHELAVWTCHASWTWSCAWTWKRSIDMDMQHALWHQAGTWISTCCMSKFLSILHVRPSMLHVPAHAACSFSFYMPMSMLHVYVCVRVFMLHIRVHATYPCQCCMSPELHIQLNVAETWTCSMELVMQHGHGHVAWTNTCSPCSCLCCMSTTMFILHVPVTVNAACTSTGKCCMSMSMQHGYGHEAWT